MTTSAAASFGTAFSGFSLGRDDALPYEERSRYLARLHSLENRPSANVPLLPSVDVMVPPPNDSEPAEEPQGAGFIDRGLPIPDVYGMDRVVAIVRDPYWLFVYWDFNGGSLERLRFEKSAHVVDRARWVLRIDSMPQRQRHLVDIDPAACKWYVRVAPASSYLVSIGFVTPEDGYVRICGTEEIRTPSTAVTSVADEDWFVSREDLQQLLKTVGGSCDPSILQHGMHKTERIDPPRAAGLFSARWSAVREHLKNKV